MSGGSSANNSWTILTSEETVAETLRPLAEGTDHHEESHTSAAGSGENNQPANGAQSAEGLPVENYPVSEGKTAELSGDSSTDQHTSVPTTVPDNLIPSSLEVSGSSNHGDEVSQTQVPPEDPVQISPDPDSSSDSYTHITPSPDEPPLSLLSTENLGGADFTQEEEKLTQEETLHPLNGEELHQEDESEHYSRTPDIGKQADSEVGDERTEKTGEGDPEASRRRSLLAALEQIGRREEEEAEQDEFQLPQREEDDSGFSVNKCILGAVILLGLGTIFFSGVFMDLDEENDYGTRELKDTAGPGKQEWFNPEVPPHPVAVDNSELLNKLAEGNEQISVLQAQLQAQKEELSVAKGHAAEGAKERLQWEEVEKENSRLKTEMASLLVLQKENERMKKELESVLALQKELETLRSTVTELKLSSAASRTSQAPVKPPISPPSGQPEDSRQSTTESMMRPARKALDDQKERKKDLKREKYDAGEKKDWKEKSVWKEGGIKERKDGGKPERKRGKHEFDKEKEKEGKPKRHSDETEQWKEKSWKKDKDRRGDEGKPWKDREGKREWIEKSEKKEWKEEKERKKAKHEKVNEGKQRRAKDENKDWKGGKDHGERCKNEWKGEKEWKKVKNGFKESGKNKWEKEWKKDTEWKNKNGKDWGKEGKERGERKQWEGDKNHGKEKSGKYERKRQNEHEWKSKNGKHDEDWKRRDEEMDQRTKKEWKRGGQKEKKHNGDGRKDGSNTQKKHFTGNHGHREEHLYGDRKPPHSHHSASMGQPEYWVHQRDRLHHNPKPPQQCDSVESCAQAERLLPVPLPEFEAILLTYLAKAEAAGVDNTKIGELQKLTTDFFKDGLFIHDQMSFQDFVEDVGDILEDMVEGDNEEEEDSAIEEEMEGFEREVMKKFSMPGAGEKEQRIKGEWRKESGQGRG